ncbi:MAG: class I poly(R)-hydroxyalkanoic acid synthase [Pseudomonas fluorescens]|nr:MAG: class I poly(R)-hydroxyalkanoic acid synthase [Pseudomonas fluorescens]
MQTMKPVMQAFGNAANALAANPHALVQQTLQWHQAHLALGANFIEQMLGRSTSPVAIPQRDDKRFSHESWNSAFFDLMKQSYLLTSQYLTNAVASTNGITEEDRTRVDFYTRQFIDALSPSNFLFTNPEAISTALSSNGESLVQGFQNFLGDVTRGSISTTDMQKFAVGENIAITPGNVVFRNNLIELIQYTPTTKQVNAKPLVICPPWINRFYILDLQPQNSFVKYMVDQGFTVFMVSWKNPTAEYRDVGFENYITDGLYEAIDAACAITGESSVNAIGYCIGGTMLSAALSVMQQNNDKRINSATFFTTLTEFSKAGELCLFTDEAQLDALDKRMDRDGVLDGKAMATTFSMMRANDMIWSFVVNNYLLGKQPFPFDILYWNNDSTRMPYAMHSWYLRNLYLHNKMAKPNALKVLGKGIDLTKLDLPMYMVGAINDHITPWASTYAPFAGMASKSKRFVLSKAGHVAGVVNPPTPEGKPVKRSYWVGEAGNPYAEAWLRTAQEHQDSWWPDYATWLTKLSGSKVAAPTKAGNTKYKAIASAPGTYVREQ